MSVQIQKVLGYLALFAGWLAVAIGSFGLWMQGYGMYSGDSLVNIADCLCPEDICASIFLPVFVFSMGAMLVSWVILASKLTEGFSLTKKNIIFSTFALTLLVACIVPAKIATNQVWARATAAEAEYYQNKYTNAPSAALVNSNQVQNVQ
jgi:hypothetical protein